MSRVVRPRPSPYHNHGPQLAQTVRARFRTARVPWKPGKKSHPAPFQSATRFSESLAGKSFEM